MKNACFLQTDIRRQMEDIIRFETKIAEITAPASEQRNNKIIKKI